LIKLSQKYGTLLKQNKCNAAALNRTFPKTAVGDKLFKKYLVELAGKSPFDKTMGLYSWLVELRGLARVFT
jgi:hypothetical protein